MRYLREGIQWTSRRCTPYRPSAAPNVHEARAAVSNLAQTRPHANIGTQYTTTL